MRKIIILIAVLLLAACGSPAPTLSMGDADYCDLLNTADMASLGGGVPTATDEGATETTIFCEYRFADGESIVINLSFHEGRSQARTSYQNGRDLLAGAVTTEDIPGGWDAAFWFGEGVQFYSGNMVVTTAYTGSTDVRNVSIEVAREVLDQLGTLE